MEGLQRRLTKIIKGVKDFSYRKRLEKIGLTRLLERKVKGDLIETLKIVDGVFNYGGQFFTISLQTVNLLSR